MRPPRPDPKALDDLLIAPVGRDKTGLFGPTRWMPDIMRPAAQKVAGAMVVAALLYAVPPAGLYAQTDERAGDPGLGVPLDVCEDDEQDDAEFEPCGDYLDANIKSDADTVKWMLEQIKDRKPTQNKSVPSIMVEMKSCNGLLSF
jgi:hypothetical protein